MSKLTQPPPEIFGSPSLRMILNRIDGLQEGPSFRRGSIPVSSEQNVAPPVKILDHAVWDLAAWHPAAWQSSMPEIGGPASRLAVAFGGGFVVPLLLGISFAWSMISGPPLAAKATQIGVQAEAPTVMPHQQRLLAFAAPDFFESAWTALPVAPLVASQDARRVDVVNGMVNQIAQIRVPVSTENPIPPQPLAKRIDLPVAPASVVRTMPKLAATDVTRDQSAYSRGEVAIKKSASPNIIRAPAHIVHPAVNQVPHSMRSKAEPKAVAASQAVASADVALAKSKAARAVRVAEPWASSWHRSALGMTQQKQ